jgi:sec-independent protein translocase protein TatA
MGDGLFAPWHIIILLVVLVLLFGSRRLPGAAKSLGDSMHIFKRSVAGLNSDNDASKPDTGSGFSASSIYPPATPVQQLQPQDGTQNQLQDLQRQVEELQRQQAASGNAGQPNQPF